MANKAPEKVDIRQFLIRAGNTPVIDVRSPSEFISGHMPGAFNIPLFNDAERAIIGTKYKQEGRREAILAGLELTGTSMHVKLSEALSLAKENRLLVHCWRGGMRSEAMAWLFSMADLEISILEGGYKSYRHHVLSELSEKRKIIVLGGMTGSGKTHILRHIMKSGNQVIDLEGIACHKGSAFGSLGQPSQPTSEHFANLVYDQWRHLDTNQPVWLEDESRSIGTIFQPDCFYNNYQEAPVIILKMEIKTRLPRLISEYSMYPVDTLKASIMRISKRLGGDNTRDALSAIGNGDFAKAIEISLRYYDKAYMYGISAKISRKIIFIESDTDSIEANAGKVLEAAGRIDW